MNLIELTCALKQIRLGGMAVVLETRLGQAQGERPHRSDLLLGFRRVAPRGERLLERRKKQAHLRDSQVR